MDDIAPFHVMSLLGRAKELEGQGRDIIHMEVGEPDFDTPTPVREAGAKAIMDGNTFYTAATGMPPLKTAIADFYARIYDVALAPDRVVVTPGASGALQLVLTTLIDPGDGVILTDPGYPCNRHFVRLLHGRVIDVRLAAERGFRLSLEQLDQALVHKPKVLVIASPSNPTGQVYSRAELLEISNWCHQHEVTLIVDEIYQGLVYDGPPLSVLSCDDDAIVINSFSKYFNMTGWRLGWCVLPTSLVPYADRLAQNVYLSAPTVAQIAAITALSPALDATYQQRVAEFKARRNYLYEALSTVGFEFAAKPEGAFYLFGKCDAFTLDSFEFCRQLLEQEGVAITPGVDFGPSYAKQYVRFAYTNPVTRLAEGVSRIEHFIKSRG